jgi:hypothetical protein
MRQFHDRFDTVLNSSALDSSALDFSALDFSARTGFFFSVADPGWPV